ncbi:MAG: ATP-dependent metallopeptidase FtsH/Yme1/Tma family protein [Ruminococcaceae bacterium]|nr:ATP-dependent metallopeptidase FtsH/Yme1/Tma family protein [Oscillospiraceae bacterium]
MTKKPRFINVIILVGILVLLFVLFRTNFNSQEPGLIYSEVIGYFEDGRVSEFTLDVGNGNLEYKLDGMTNSETYKMPYAALFVEALPDYVDAYEQKHNGARMRYDLKYSSDNSMWLYLIPSIILLVALGALIYYVMFMQNEGGGKGALNVGKAKVKNQADAKNKPKTTFQDVAGADEEKEELEEIVQFLKNPKRFSVLGARIPHGVLLVGPPGTGKTLLARACAGEAGVPFYSISGSDFVEMYVGVGASRVRDLFDKAKKTAPCIVFIDEIDAVGRQRGAGLGGGHDEREQTLNQLLVEMDGFDGNEGVIVVAATNRADILDKALLRPGRFDRQVYVGYPDVKGREEILKVHTKTKPLAPDVDLKIIARTTPGFTGADLENLVNEAALLAARRNRKAIIEADIEAASVKVMMGPEKKSRVVTEKERRLTAYHEAGHAIASYYCLTSDPVHQITIIPHGPAGGFTMYRPEDDATSQTKTQMRERIISMLGGRVAEKLVLDDISTGASQDLKSATNTARAMVTRYGFSERLGLVVYDSDPGETFLGRDYGHTRTYSEEIASEIDSEVRTMLDNAFDAATRILEEHMDQLHLVSATLLEREKLSGDEFRILMEGGELPPFEDPKMFEPATEPEADGVEALDADRDKGPDERVEDELGYTGVDANAAGLDDEDDDYADEDNLEDEEAFEDDEGEEPNNKA